MIEPTDLSRGLCEASIVGEAEVSLDWDLHKISLTETNRYWEKNKSKREDEQSETEEQSEDDEQTEDDEHDATRRSAHDGNQHVRKQSK